MTISHRNDREASALDRFADCLKELHRLSTTSYESLGDAFQDHLRTGRRLFGSPMGMIMRAEAEATGIQKTGTCQRTSTGIQETCCQAILAVDGDTPDVWPGSAPCVQTPIMLGKEMWATLSFSSAPERVE